MLWKKLVWCVGMIFTHHQQVWHLCLLLFDLTYWTLVNICAQRAFRRIFSEVTLNMKFPCVLMMSCLFFLQLNHGDTSSSAGMDQICCRHTLPTMQSPTFCYTGRGYRTSPKNKVWIKKAGKSNDQRKIKVPDKQNITLEFRSCAVLVFNPSFNEANWFFSKDNLHIYIRLYACHRDPFWHNLVIRILFWQPSMK